MPTGIYIRTSGGEEHRRDAIRKHLPRTAFKKGVNSYPDTKFKKGYTPWNKDTVGISKGGRKGKLFVIT